MTTKIRGEQIETGTGPGSVVQLDSSSRLPGVDGSLLINLPGSAPNFLTANNGVDFTVAPTATGLLAISSGQGATASSTYSIAVGYNATANTNDATLAIGTGANASGYGGIALGAYSVAAGSSSVAIGNSAVTVQAASNNSVAIGVSVNTDLANQVAIGTTFSNLQIPSTAFSVRLGNGAANIDRNVLHLHDKGKLEVIGSEAQFILPNYITAAIPATTNEGGMVWDSTTKELKIYDGTTFAPISGGGGGVTNPLTSNLDAGGFNIITSDVTTAVASNTITIKGGDNSYLGGSYYAGSVHVYGGNGTSGNYGGYVNVIGGYSDTSAAGYITILGGYSNSGTGGNVSISGGGTTTGNMAGNVLIAGAGSGVGSTANGGDVSISGGTSAAVGFIGGNVQIRPGGGTTIGTIQILPVAASGSGSLDIHDLTGGFKSTLGAGSLAADTIFTLPVTNGNVGDVLSTDGAGAMSFVPNSDLGEFTIALLPAAATHANSYAVATDAVGGRTIVRSDGINWKIVVVEGATVA